MTTCKLDDSACSGGLLPPVLLQQITLLTDDTTQSSTSPLNGLKVMHWNVALKVASPLPSCLILPCQERQGTQR